jgi:hypothetical protein
MRTLNMAKAVASEPVVIDRPLSEVKGALYTILLNVSGDYNLLAGPGDERAMVSRGVNDMTWTKPGQPPQMYILGSNEDGQTTLIFVSEVVKDVAEIAPDMLTAVAGHFGFVATLSAGRILRELDGSTHEIE